MSARRYRLTPEMITDIVSRIKGGAYASVAAQASGLPPEVFQQWMERGTSKNARSPYHEFAASIQAGIAHARCMAEINMRTENPKGWLMHGPGKDSPSQGWTAAVRATVPPTPEAVNLLMDPQFQELLARLLLALAPYPEARQAAAAVLWNEDPPTRMIEQVPLKPCEDE